jgi:hypothetical protein
MLKPLAGMLVETYRKLPSRLKVMIKNEMEIQEDALRQIARTLGGEVENEIGYSLEK